MDTDIVGNRGKERSRAPEQHRDICSIEMKLCVSIPVIKIRYCKDPCAGRGQFGIGRQTRYMVGSYRQKHPSPHKGCCNGYRRLKLFEKHDDGWYPA